MFLRSLLTEFSIILLRLQILQPFRSLLLQRSKPSLTLQTILAVEFPYFSLLYHRGLVLLSELCLLVARVGCMSLLVSKFS
jgi:hypothetical protein